MGMMDLWTVSSCNLPVPYGPFQTQSWTYHFYSVRQCCWVHPTLWLGGSNNNLWGIAQAACLLGSPCLNAQFLANPKAGHFLNGEYFLQRRAGLCSKILRVCTVIHLDLPKPPNSILIWLWHSKTIGSAGSYGPSVRAACLASWTSCSALLFFWPSLKASCFLSFLAKKLE